MAHLILYETCTKDNLMKNHQKKILPHSIYCCELNRVTFLFFLQNYVQIPKGASRAKALLNTLSRAFCTLIKHVCKTDKRRAHCSLPRPLGRPPAACSPSQVRNARRGSTFWCHRQATVSRPHHMKPTSQHNVLISTGSLLIPRLLILQLFLL